MVTSKGGCADESPKSVGRNRTPLAVSCPGEGAPPEGASMVVSVRYMAIVPYCCVVTDDVLAARRANFARAWRSSPWAASTNSLAAETFLGGDNLPASHWVRASRRRSFPLLV